MNRAIRDYWDRRARDAAGAVNATTDDVHYRALEHATLVRALAATTAPAARVLDAGCGDGLTTLRVAADLGERTFLGVDNAAGMLASARVHRAQAGPPVRRRVRFRHADVTDLAAAIGDEHFDAAFTCRCLINLETPAAQYDAIDRLAATLRPGGRLFAIEGFVEGQERLNAARRAVDLPEIPVRWHNLFFGEDEFVRETGRRFRRVTFEDFASSYYFATRVVYAAACRVRGATPDYDHPVHRIAPSLPWTGRFAPTRMAILEK